MKEIPKGLIVWQNCSAPNQEGSVVIAERSRGGKKDREDKPAKGRKIKALQQGLSFPMTHTSSIVN